MHSYALVWSFPWKRASAFIAKADRSIFKSVLNLTGKYLSLSYNALTAYTAIVFTRYMLLALEQRKNKGQSTLEELLFFLVDKMAAIRFSHSLNILMGQ